MQMKLLLTTVTIALALSACSKQENTSNAEVETGAAEDVTTQTRNPAASDEADNAVTKDGTAIASDQDKSATLEKSFPEPLRGKWRETESASVTAAECDNTKAGNMGKVLNVRDDSFSWFETGGRILGVQERSPTRIRALFDTTYADEETRAIYSFDVQDSGKTLVMREYGKNSRPGPTRYLRCSA